MSAALGLGVSVTVHVDSATGVEPRLLTVHGQLCPLLQLDGNRGQVSVFADRSDLVRLQNAISSLLADLDAAQAKERESAA